MEQFVLKVFLLSEREISPNYTDIFLDFVRGFGSYVKGLPKTKRCNLVAVTVSVQIRCICETALILHSSLTCKFLQHSSCKHAFSIRVEISVDSDQMALLEAS